MTYELTNQSRTAFQLAIQAFNTGDLAKSQSICRESLSRDPSHADALHLLGVISHQAGQPDQAERYLNQAIAISPNQANYHNTLGVILRDQRRYDGAIAACRAAIRINSASFEPYLNLGNALRDIDKPGDAAAAYRQALARSPGNAAVLKNLGCALGEVGQLDEAINTLSETVRLKPDWAEALSDLANFLRENGDLPAADGFCRRAIELRPDFAEAFYNLGLIRLARLDYDGAITAYGRAVELKPTWALARVNFAAALFKGGRFVEAIAEYQRAISLSPHNAAALSSLGAVFIETRQFDEAAAVLRRAIEIKPDFAEAHSNLSAALYRLGRIDEAASSARQAINLNPDHADAHWNLAFSLLTQGNLPEGFREYEWRLRTEKGSARCRDFAQPLWNGRDLGGERILLHAEQGFGDTLQFVRYVPLVAQRGGRVILECQPALYRLFLGVPGVEMLVVKGESLPPFDWHCPLMSLPLAFNTELSSIPNSVPYLKCDPALSTKWASCLASGSSGRRVGVVWAGSPVQKQDPNRSMKLAELAPLASITNVMFYSLQKGEARRQPSSEGLTIRDFTSELNDFADTAAFIECLDLVIAVDTAVAHLAGAMGKPVWTLLAFSPDWRWLRDREDSPWYPTMRLFQQTRAGDWDGPVRRVREMFFHF